MRILLAHNRYKYRGGEDSVFQAEGQLLRDNGHDVLEYLKSNEDMDQKGSVQVALNAIWSRSAYRELRQRIREVRPDVVHLHNHMPQISPAIFYAGHAEGVPVVHTLHNFRMLCLNGMLMREEQVCELCVDKRLKWPGIRHACYRESRLGSAAVASMLSVHDAIGTWRDKVTRYLVLTEFQRNKLIAAGIPEKRLVVKPNFCADPGRPTADPAGRTRGLFIGRLSHEKGVDVLVAAAKTSDAQIDLVGSGPKLDEVRAAAPDNLIVHGFVDDDVMRRVKETALFLVLPSIVYEGFPMVIPEAFAMGIPVIASRHGAMQEVVQDGHTGLHFTPGDAEDLAAKIRWATDHPDEMRAFGQNARDIYEREYSPTQNHRRLVDIYQEAIDEISAPCSIKKQ